VTIFNLHLPGWIERFKTRAYKPDFSKPLKVVEELPPKTIYIKNPETYRIQSVKDL